MAGLIYVTGVAASCSRYFPLLCSVYGTCIKKKLLDQRNYIYTCRHAINLILRSRVEPGNEVSIQ